MHLASSNSFLACAISFPHPFIHKEEEFMTRKDNDFHVKCLSGGYAIGQLSIARELRSTSSGNGSIYSADMIWLHRDRSLGIRRYSNSLWSAKCADTATHSASDFPWIGIGCFNWVHSPTMLDRESFSIHHSHVPLDAHDRFKIQVSVQPTEQFVRSKLRMKTRGTRFI